MRIALFAPLPRYHPDAPRLRPPTVPLAPYVLAAACRDAGHEVCVVDPNLHPDIDDGGEALFQIVDRADVVGISCHTFNWPAAQRLARAVKDLRPERWVVMGGIHPTHMWRRVLQVGTTDFVVIGDGERPLVSLLNALEAGTDAATIDGVAGKTFDPTIASPAAVGLTLPAYDLVPRGCYSTLSFETSRGCVGDCAFCSIINRRRWRPIPAPDVVAGLEIALKQAIDIVTAKNLYLVDDCLTVDRHRALEICQGLRRVAGDWSITLEARLGDLMHPEVIEGLSMLPRSGYQVGVECGYDEGIIRAGKRFGTEQVLDVMQRLTAAGLAERAQMMFIIALPWEGLGECLATVRFAAGLAQRFGCRCNLSWWRPIPSRLWTDRRKFGIAHDEELFDQEGWVSDPEVLYSLHPALSQQDMHHIQAVIDGYRDVGITLRLTEI